MTVLNNGILVTPGTGSEAATHVPASQTKEWQGIVNCNKDGSIFGDAPTFWFVADRIVPAANKYILDVFNTSATVVVRVKRIWIANWQTAAVTGLFTEGTMLRITARTIGTTITPFLNDTNEALPAGVTGSSASTVVTASTMHSRWSRFLDEGITNTLIPSSLQYQNWPDCCLAYEQGQAGQSPIVLRTNQGFAVQQVSATAVGTLSVIMEVTAAVE